MPEEPIEIQCLTTGELERELRRVELGGTVGDHRLSAELQRYALEVAIANRTKPTIVNKDDGALALR